ncbi:MAG TPA: GNAT family protein [Candidatus Saccharimonadales bacterium]
MPEALPGSPEQAEPLEISLDGYILLRQVTPEDSQTMFDLIDRNRDHLSQHGDDTAGNYTTPESVAERNELQGDNELRFGIWDTSINESEHLAKRFEPRLAGFIKLTQKPDAPIEIGYYLDEAQQYKGIMARQLLGWL